MEPLTARHDAIDHYESPVRPWRVSQLRRFGISGPLAGSYADASNGVRSPGSCGAAAPSAHPAHHPVTTAWT